VRLWLILALACIVGIVFWPSSVILYQKWTDTSGLTYTHGWLILLICVVLVIRARREITTAPQGRLSPLACAALALAVLAWLLCYRGSIEGLEVPLVPLIFWLAVTVTCGWPVGRVMLFPVGFFYFAVPSWDNRPLQQLTVFAMHAWLGVTGPPATFAGDVIYIPNGAFRIEEGCSGLHFMIVGLAVAALYGEQQRDSWPTRIKLLLLMAVLAILANWVRVYTVIEAGYLTDMQSYLVRVSHYGFGWCVFAVALLAFFWLASKFPASAAVAPPVSAASAASAGRREVAGVAAALAIVLLLPALSAVLRSLNPETRDLGAAVALDPPGTWRQVAIDPRSTWSPVFEGADVLQRYSFTDPAGDSLEVVTVGLRSQRQGAELVGETSSLEGEQLATTAVRTAHTPAGDFRETEVIDQSRRRSLIWTRYQVGGRTLLSPFAQQLYYGANAIVRRPPSSLLALRTACHDDCADARRVLESFVRRSASP
jgi:EpsI family protein